MKNAVSPKNYEACEVYIFTAVDGDGPLYVKIGVSSRPEARLVSIQTGCPVRIASGRAIRCTARVIAVAMEASMHQELAAYRCSGEWFKFENGLQAHAEALEDAIRRHADGMGVGVRQLDLASGWKLRREDAKQRSQVAITERREKDARDRAAAWNVSPERLGVADTQ